MNEDFDARWRLLMENLEETERRNDTLNALMDAELERRARREQAEVLFWAACGGAALVIFALGMALGVALVAVPKP